MGEFSAWIFRYLEENPGADNAVELRVVANRLQEYQDAIKALNEGEAEMARELLAGLAERHPSDKMSALNLAFAEIETGNPERALTRLEELAPDFEGDARHTVLCARAEIRMGDREKGFQRLWDAQEASPSDRQIAAELQRHGEFVPVQFSIGAPGQTRYMARAEFGEAAAKRARQLAEAKDTERLLALAERLIEGGRPALGVDMADIGLEADPENARLHRLRAQGLTLAGRLDEAVESASRAIELAPESSRARASLGRAQREKGDLEAAQASLSEAIRLDPQNIDAYEQLLLSLPEEERMARAEQLAQEHPKSWIPGKLVGDLLFAKGETEAALEKHMTAWHAGDHDDALTMLLHDLGQLGRIEEAVKVIEKAQHLNRRNGNARWNAANLLLEGGRGRAAADVLRAMVEDDRLSPEMRSSANRLLAQVMPKRR
jgi:tetratricopeptide (TPR) repeat protein